MSDIYLQITETPTVVTLSAPVVSGALAATVTVANVVSVNVVTMPSISVQAPSVTTVIGSVTLGASTAQIGSVTASISGTVPVSGTFYQATQPVSLASVPAHAVTLTSTTVTVSSLPALAAGTAQIGSVTASISGTVPVSGTFYQATQPVSGTFWQATQPVSLTSTTVTVNSLPSLAAGTNQIGSVTASISGTVPVSISSVTIGNSVTIGSCVTHGVTIANTVVTFTPAQGTTVSNTNFTSITPSTTLVSAVEGREVLTVFNEGPTLYISPGATCTTISYQVRLSAGDYWECPQGQLSLAHTAVFATAGTARVTEVS